jgi:CHAT domain-containing protein
MAPVQRGNLSLTLVAEKRAKQRNLELIPGVDKEIEYVAAAASLCNVKVLHQWVGSTILTDTADIMQRANVVHLACHGVQDTSDATKSGFCLGDGRLTIAKLMELKLDDAFLAFLSACETAKGDKEQPDQAMHLAAAMLFSGFKSVVATMWHVDDYCCEPASADQRQGDIRCRWAESRQVVLRGVIFQRFD